MTTALPDDQLFDLPTLPERLLSLADEFIGHNDAFAQDSAARMGAAELRERFPSARSLAERALEIRESVEHTLRPAPAVVDVSLELQQMAFLASGAADELLIALGLVQKGKAGAETHIQLAGALTALGAPASVDLAERLTAEMHRQRVPLSGELLQLSSADIAAMRAVARGKVHVTLMLGRQYITHEGGARLSINTVRALEAPSFLRRDGVQKESVPQRLRLTTAGIRALAGAFGRTPPPVSGPRSVPPLPQSTSVKRSR
ncbi:hypothetical protein ACFW5D_30170 [Streptomyces sp. NPDC058770]|uniref:hypothetical protein n=1 Tax=Streptomyces sp. NPDC058770 TaxID=3346631 RepID=UPI0036C9E82E